MLLDDLFAVLTKVNNEREEPVEEDIMKQVIALVDKNPLDDDRHVCQEQIAALIKGRVKERSR